MRKTLILIYLLSFSLTAKAAFVDFSANYWYSEQLFGVEDENKIISQTIGVNWAWYLWATTAIELNYSQNIIEDDYNTDFTDGTDTINRIYKKTTTKVYGIGIRQALAGRKSRIIPSIYIGTATQKSLEEQTIVLNDTATPLNPKEIEQSSGQVSFALRIRLTELMGLRFSARSVFPDFDTSKIRNNVTYSAGLSWVF